VILACGPYKAPPPPLVSFRDLPKTPYPLNSRARHSLRDCGYVFCPSLSCCSLAADRQVARQLWVFSSVQFTAMTQIPLPCIFFLLFPPREREVGLSGTEMAFSRLHNPVLPPDRLPGDRSFTYKRHSDGDCRRPLSEPQDYGSRRFALLLLLEFSSSLPRLFLLRCPVFGYD